MKNYVLYNAFDKKEMEIIIEENNLKLVYFFGEELTDSEAYSSPLDIPIFRSPSNTKKIDGSIIYLWHDASGFYRIQFTTDEGPGIINVIEKEDSIDTFLITLNRDSICTNCSLYSSSFTLPILYLNRAKYGKIEKTENRIQLKEGDDSLKITFSIEKENNKVHFKVIINGELKEDLYIHQDSVDKDFFYFYCLHKMNYIPFSYESLPL